MSQNLLMLSIMKFVKFLCCERYYYYLHVFFCCNTTSKSGRPVIGSRYFAQIPYTLRSIHACRNKQMFIPHKTCIRHTVQIPRHSSTSSAHVDIPICHPTNGLDFCDGVHPSQSHCIIQSSEHLPTRAHLGSGSTRSALDRGEIKRYVHRSGGKACVWLAACLPQRL